LFSGDENKSETLLTILSSTSISLWDYPHVGINIKSNAPVKILIKKAARVSKYYF